MPIPGMPRYINRHGTSIVRPKRVTKDEWARIRGDIAATMTAVKRHDEELPALHDWYIVLDSLSRVLLEAGKVPSTREELHQVCQRAGVTTRAGVRAVENLQAVLHPELEGTYHVPLNQALRQADLYSWDEWMRVRQ